MFSSLVQFKVIPANTDTVLLSRSTLRYGILFSNVSAADIYLANSPMTGVRQGLYIGSANTSTYPLFLDCVTYGDCVHNEWHVWANPGATMAFIEVMACSCEDLALLTDALGHKPDSAYDAAIIAQRGQGPLTKTRRKEY